MVNFRGDGLSGLTIDRYGEVLFCEVASVGVFQRLPRWLPLLHARSVERSRCMLTSTTRSEAWRASNRR